MFKPTTDSSLPAVSHKYRNLASKPYAQFPTELVFGLFPRG